MNDDKKLYQKFINGDKYAFEELVIRHKDNLIYFLSRYTGGDIYSAEDLAQDVFAHLFVFKDSYNPEYSFKTFIFTIGRNKAIDYMRKQSRLSFNTSYSEIEMQGDYEVLEDIVIDNEEKREVFQAIKSLKPDYQRALHLYAIEELSYKEIAKVMGKTHAQVKIMLYRARNSLKASLGEEAARDEE